jgi:ABC-2 type transport system permease protein
VSGTRWRHCSPPGSPILFGKVAAATLYGWLAAVLVAVLGLVTANLAAGGDGPRFYAPAVLGGGLVLSLLVALLAAAGGCLVSLRAGTVRQAQQVMGLISIVFVIPVVVVPLLPGAVRQGLFALLTSTSPGRLAAGAVLLLALTDAALVALALVRFRRARLMLD